VPHLTPKAPPNSNLSDLREIWNLRGRRNPAAAISSKVTKKIKVKNVAESTVVSLRIYVSGESER
jgi:hypothetical protein